MTITFTTVVTNLGLLFFLQTEYFQPSLKGNNFIVLPNHDSYFCAIQNRIGFTAVASISQIVLAYNSKVYFSFVLFVPPVAEWL